MSARGGTPVEGGAPARGVGPAPRMSPVLDAAVIGSGPNGLAAAITLAGAGHRVHLYEARDTIGGGVRSAELTEPGLVHDVCSAIHPLLAASPFFGTLDLPALGVDLVQPDIALAHPLEDGRVAILARSVEETAARLGPDRDAYLRLMVPLLERADALLAELLRPLRIPRHPVTLARYALSGIRGATGFAAARFSGEEARALFAGVAAHSLAPLERSLTAGVGILLLLLGHHVGWPLVRGGSQRIADAMAAHLRSLGGEIHLGAPIRSMDDLPPARAYLFDVTPRQVLRIVGPRLPATYRRRLERFRYGPGVFKVDWALSEPVPWAPAEARRAGTVHLGGTMAEIAASERAAHARTRAARPFVLIGQQSLFDPARTGGAARPSREPRHTLWGYCHVPHGSQRDMTEVIESQIERFAPGFRDTITARRTLDPAQLESYNPNYVGGDINGGSLDLRQLFLRPVARFDPYSTPARDIYICSASTPPGGGVHGMCGYLAARSALRRALGRSRG